MNPATRLRLTLKPIRIPFFPFRPFRVFRVFRGPPPVPQASNMSPTPSPSYDLEIFYDGDCPLCRREISMVRRLDRRARLRLTDIAAPDFSPASYGLSMADFMGQIQGRLPGGEWVAGVEVFRRMYAAIGGRWLVPVTRLPVISHLLDYGYRVFARNRLRWTGRCNAACTLDSAPTSPPRT